MSQQTFFGWYIVAAAFLIAVLGWGVGFYGPSVYLQAVEQARGWSVALVSGAVTLHFLTGTVVIANLPAFHRRFGVPVVTFAGAVLLAFGVIGWATALSPWQLYAATLFSGAGWPALGAAAVNAIIAPWFITKRPAALSMAYNGASIGGVIFSPLWVALIGAIGFPAAATVIGFVLVCMIAILAVTVLGRTPDNMGQRPDGEALKPATTTRLVVGTVTVGRLSRDLAFLTLSFGMALTLFAQIGLIAQLVSLLEPALGTWGAGLAAGLSTAATILGRLLVGWFMPSGADRRIIASASLLVQVTGCIVLYAADGMSAPLLLVGVILIGLGIGNATSLSNGTQTGPPIGVQKGL